LAFFCLSFSLRAQNKHGQLPKVGDLKRVKDMSKNGGGVKAPDQSCFICNFDNPDNLIIDWKIDKNANTVFHCSKKLL